MLFLSSLSQILSNDRLDAFRSKFSNDPYVSNTENLLPLNDLHLGMSESSIYFSRSTLQ